MLSQSSSNASASTSTSLDATNNKYHGLLAISKLSIIKHIVYDFFSFFNSIAHPSIIYAFIINAWRTIQWAGPSLIPESSTLYPSKTVEQILTDAISFFFRIVPASIKGQEFIYYAIIDIVLFYAFCIILLITIYIFNKNGKISNGVVTAYYFIFDGIWYLVAPASFTQCGHRIGYTFIQNGDVKDVASWVLIILLLISFCLYFFITAFYSSVSISYRVMTFGAFDPRLERYFLIVPGLLGFLSGLCPYLPKVGRYVVYAIMILLYIDGIFAIWLMAGFTQTIWNSVLTAASIVAIVSTVVAWIYDYKQKAYPVIIIFCLILIFFVLIGVVQIINNHLTVKAFTLLDEYYENKSLYQENQPGLMKCYFMATRGLVCAHPSVIGCDHMHNMLQLYPKNINAWVFFARMLAAFPEENNKLLWVDDQIRHLHANSIYMSHLKAQIMFLARSRETAMTHTLKKKVNTLQKDIQSTKNKLRHFWECVIQGNTDDMEIASAAARKSVEKTESNINHLNRIYRNNQYVARLYSRFLIHVKGDRIAYNEWHSNIEKLKNGQTIVPDYAQMDTIQLFPLILNSTTQQSNTEMIGGLFGESTSMPSISSSSCHVIDNDEEENNLLMTIKNSVTTMSIPSIRTSIIMITVISVLICVLFFPIMVSIFVSLSTKSFTKIAIISNCSQINTDITHMVILSLSNLVQSAGYYPTFEMWLIKLFLEQNITSMGGLTDQSAMLKYIIADSGEMITNIRKLNDMMDQSDELAQAQALLFQNVLTVNTSRSLGGGGNRPGGNRPGGNFGTRNSWTTNNYSAETLIVSLGLDASTLLDTMNSTEAKQYLQSSTLGNNNRFLAAIQKAIMAAQIYIKTDIENNQSYLKKVIYIVGYCGVAAAVILYIICMIYVSVAVNGDKRVAAKSFLTIPKHVISKLVDSLKMNTGKNNLEEEDFDEVNEVQRNRQEENFIALLATTSSASRVLMKLTTHVLIAIFILMALSVCCIIFSAYNIVSSNEIIRLASPHAMNFLTMYTMLANSIIPIMSVVVNDLGTPILGEEREEQITGLFTTIAYAMSFYQTTRFGKVEDNMRPLSYIDEQISNDAFAPIDSSIPLSAEDPRGFSPDMLFNNIANAVSRLGYISMTQNMTFDDTIAFTWYCLFNCLYDKYYAPHASLMVNLVSDSFNKHIEASVLWAVLFIVLCIITYIFIIVRLITIKNDVSWMISTLMLCKPDVLLASKAICSILQSEFKEVKSKSSLANDEEFHKELVNLFIDSVIFINPNLTITAANPATKRIFDSEGDIVGKQITDVINGEEGSDSAKFIQALYDGVSGHSGLKINRTVEIMRSDGTQVYINLNVTAFSRKGAVQSLADAGGNLKSLSIVCRDISQQVRSDNLLKAERQRSDALLRHILPPPIVDSLQSGEKDVSFAVTSASICFMDIVSFTPWCGANTAQMVCSTLNKLFKYFDMNLAQHKTMTKIKCIGDCYMGAGGIFDNPNDPKKHAWDLVHFGCEAIRSVRKLDEELGQQLQIRVGVNTGGPIVAGVLGVGRPTFEILGPAINMAQQMEHHGVPMKVHISRPVYENIYESGFVIHERGEVEVKNGKVTTYLVDPDENPE